VHSFVRAIEGVFATHEIQAAATHQADAIQVFLRGVATGEAELHQLVRREQAQAAIGHGHHEIRDRDASAVALQVGLHLVVDFVQFRAELAARGRVGLDADDAMDADRARDHAIVAAGQQQHAGAVADRAFAHPDRPVALGDDVAGADRVFHLAAARIDVEDAALDAHAHRHVGDAFDQRGEVAGDAAAIAQAQHAGVLARQHRVEHGEEAQVGEHDAVAVGLVHRCRS
jgi:hypothetical protein